MDRLSRAASAPNGYTLIRILIASYFVAFALQIIPGTEVAVLLRPFLSDVSALMIANAAVLASAVAIVVGWQRRAAALLLALMLFWASYLCMIEQPEKGLGGFWRDLALIGALMLTYADTEARGNDALTFIRHLPRRRRERSDEDAPTETRTLSRGSVQNAYRVGRGGRAVSRLASDSEARPYREDLARAR